MTYCNRATYYRIEYQESRDFDFIASFVEHRKKSVLEIPCGAGRLSTYLASITDDLTTIDLSWAMIEQAKKSLADVKCGTNVVVKQGDIRKVDLQRKFDLIIVPREALQLLNFQGAKMAVQNLIRHLTLEGGRLIIDLSTFITSGDPDYFYNRTDEAWHVNWTRKIDENRYLSRRSREKNTSLGIMFFFEYSILDEKSPHQWSENIFLRKYNAVNILDMISDKSIHTEFWGDYNKKKITPDSNRLIVSITMR